GNLPGREQWSQERRFFRTSPGVVRVAPRGKNHQPSCDPRCRPGRLLLEGEMTSHDAEAEGLLDRAAGGDELARQELLARYRDRLRRMVAVHLDRRLAPRVDPSDVIQEALLDASRKLSDYLEKRPLPFYPWLRRLAWERLVKLRQRHLAARKRSVAREEPQAPALPEGSHRELAEQLVASGTSPSLRLLREELRD